VKFLIKVCGATTAEDAAAAVVAGAGAVGVNFWPGSKRYVGSEAHAADVLSAVPEGVLRVGVFVNAAPEAVLATADRLGLDRVQLHGDERPQDFASLPAGLVARAIRVRDATSLAEAEGWNAGLFLYDAFVDGYGGGGVPAPWSTIATGGVRRPFLLAGGLTPDNVAAAINAVRPAGVDVASGVESAPGRKDPMLLSAFVAAARAAANEVFPFGVDAEHWPGER
jgi:phosphoribosylanthranilate isomerase